MALGFGLPKHPWGPAPLWGCASSGWWVLGAKWCPGSTESVVWSCWRGRRGLPHPMAAALVWGSHHLHPQRHPWRIQTLGAFLPPLTLPAGRNVLAATPCLAGPAWRSSLPGHAGNAAGVGTALGIPLWGWGPAVRAQPPPCSQRRFGSTSCTSLPAMLWGCIPLLLGMLHLQPLVPWLSLTTCPLPGQAGPPRRPPPLAPSPAGCRNACAWKAVPGSGCLGTGKLDPWERGRGQGTFPGCSWSPDPFVSRL